MIWEVIMKCVKRYYKLKILRRGDTRWYWWWRKKNVRAGRNQTSGSKMEVVRKSNSVVTNEYQGVI